jgi:glyoxylase-like metal-dependent hydrolase (beta-lactamase superfamily II)
MTMLNEVAPDIFRISQNKRTWFAPFSVNVFVIAGENGLVFDAGMGGRKSGEFMAEQIREIEALMKQRGKRCRITRVMISHGHWDHFSGASYLRDELDLTVLANKEMLNSIDSIKNYRRSFRRQTAVIQTPTPWIFRKMYSFVHLLFDILFFLAFKVRFVSGPVEMVTDHTELHIGDGRWEVLMMPGHCDDDMVLVNHEKGILLCGDIVLRSVNTWLGPPRSNLERYMKSLNDLARISGLKLILPAHGSPIPDPYNRLHEAIEHRKKRTMEVVQIIKSCGGEGLGFEKIFKTIYPSLRLKERMIARGWILLTLMYLMDKGMVASEIVKGKKLFRMVS